jgi:dipeptidyl aminopeptidase/acylaminoacyl peptidase
LTRSAAFLIAAVTALSLGLPPLATPPLAAQALAAQATAAPSVPTKPFAPVKPLTVEAIFAQEPLTGNSPDELSWSPDGKRLTYLEDGALMELEAGQWRKSGRKLEPDRNSEPLKARVLVSRAKLALLTAGPETETGRDHRARYKMASYLWSPEAAHLLFNRNGRLWLYDLRNGAAVEAASTGMDSGDDPKFSPDGQWLSFILGHGLAVARLTGRGMPVTVLAPALNAATLNGEVDWLYEEELDARSNYFWSPDSKKLAYLQMNEEKVPLYPLADWIPTYATVDWQRYPQAGDPNPEVRVGVVSLRQPSQTVWVNLPLRPSQDYIPRFGWADAKTVWVETLSRDQRRRALYFADAETGQARLMLQLADEKFLDNNYDLFVGLGSIVLTSWSNGHNQIYLYSYNQPEAAKGAANAAAGHPGGVDPPAHSGEQKSLGLGFELPEAQAKLVRQLTSGDFEVSELLRVDLAGKRIDYASNESSASNPNSGGKPDGASKSGGLDQQLWEVSFDGEGRQLSAGAGFHEGSFAPAGGAFVDRQSTRMEPPSLKLCGGSETARCSLFWRAPTLADYRLRAPVQFEVKAQDGTTLYATLLLPEGRNPAPANSVPANQASSIQASAILASEGPASTIQVSGTPASAGPALGIQPSTTPIPSIPAAAIPAAIPASIPLIVNPYGGPGSQSVVNRWSHSLLFDEVLAEHGFAVLHADNRGMSGRGRAFAQAAWRNFGPVQLEDQLTVVDAALAQFPQLDPNRLGWWGWSWGGSFTLYALTHSNRFRAGVAVAPVTDWRDYDSIYTERYLGEPAGFAAGYRQFSAVNSAADLKGRLLLVHGTGDDNVHLENTVQFIQKLIEAGIPYDLQIYPRKTHSISGPDARTHLYSRILAHFEQNLKPAAAEQ